MTRWTAFAAIAAAVLFFLLFLARLSQGHVSGAGSADGDPSPLPAAGDRPERPSEPAETGSAGGRSPPDEGVNRESPEGWPHPASGEYGPPGGTRESGGVGTAEEYREATPRRARARSRARGAGRREPSTASLLANVTLSQGVLLVVLAASAWLAAVPAAALGVAGVGAGEVVAGAALGVALYLSNEVGAGVAQRFGIGHDESLRDLLAPESLAGWVLLLGVVLPVIAGFEELLFRATLVGAIPAGFGVSPWVMVGFSSVAFGVGHGAQGPAGIAVTGTLGAVLGVAFVLTGSFVVVVVAHYLVNALEFVVHEGLGLDPAGLVGP